MPDFFEEFDIDVPPIGVSIEDPERLAEIEAARDETLSEDEVSEVVTRIEERYG